MATRKAKTTPRKKPAARKPVRKAAPATRKPSALDEAKARIFELQAEVDHLKEQLAMPAQALGSDELLKVAQSRIAELEAKLESTPGRLRCPRCANAMEEYTHDVVRADKCTSCGGIFFDKGELEAVIEAHDKSQHEQQKPEEKGGLLGLMKAMLGK